MNESISKYQKRGDDFVIIESNKDKFLSELSDGEIYIEILQKQSRMRTTLMNAYYWSGILGEFVKAGTFKTLDEAHEHFTSTYLKRFGVYEEFDTIEMQRDLSKARRILSSTMRNGILEVYYILSTTKLNIKETKLYWEQIIHDASEIGIVIKDPNQFDK